MNRLFKTKYRLLFLSLAISGFVLSCTSTTVEPTTTKVALANITMKNWFDVNCAKCHASGKIANKDWLYDASDFNGSIKTHLDLIYKEVITEKAMPEDTYLSAAELAKFKTWYDAGASPN
jgi:mono/diheme cytochrome c family protein